MKYNTVDMSTITEKQAYEWVKTGNWTLKQFTEWFAEQTAIARDQGIGYALEMGDSDES